MQTRNLANRIYKVVRRCVFSYEPLNQTLNCIGNCNQPNRIHMVSHRYELVNVVSKLCYQRISVCNLDSDICTSCLPHEQHNVSF